MIFLNGKRFIAEAIESALAQTYRNWELILVDDGTTDGAAAIARRYCEDHPERIRLISHPGGRNLGTGPSRSAGVRAARGDFVAFLDVDDVWLPHRLETHVAALGARRAAAMAIGPTVLWSSWDASASPWWRPWDAIDRPSELDLAQGEVFAAPALATHFLGNGGRGIPVPCSVTIRRSAIRAVGGFEDQFRLLYEDQALFFKIFLEHPVIVVGRPLDLYRQHPSSVCAASGREAGDRAARPEFLEWLRAWIEARGIADPEVRAALAAEIERASGERTEPENKSIWRRLVEVWNSESRAASVWLLTPRRHNRLRRRFGLAPIAVEIDPRRRSGLGQDRNPSSPAPR